MSENHLCPACGLVDSRLLQRHADDLRKRADDLLEVRSILIEAADRVRPADPHEACVLTGCRVALHAVAGYLRSVTACDLDCNARLLRQIEQRAKCKT